MKKDYYSLLGISKSSSDAEIKKAYKKLAMQWHPDRHQGDKKAEEKFKEINEAYQVLSDPQKRKQYDTFGTADFSGMGTGSQGFNDFDFSNLGDIFGSMGGGRASAQGFEFDLGDIFGSFGGQRRGGHTTYTRPVKEELDITQTVEIPLWDILLGTKLSLESAGKTFKVTVPPCTKPGTKLKVTGKGYVSGKRAGDLYIKIDARMPKKLTAEQQRMIELWRS